jgi:predicted MFS family arabinose efflux permease
VPVVDTSPRVRAVLKLPTYRRLLIAYTLNELAWSIGSLTLALLVYRRTGSAIGAMGYFLSAQFIPALIAPSVVARLDQRPVRRVLPTIYALEGVAFLLLGWMASRFLLAPVLALTVIDGVLALSARPIDRATTVSVTAPLGLLREANALTNASFSLCYFVGPAIGAVVVVAGGTMAALFVNSALFALIAVTIATARGLPDGTRRPAPSAGRLRAAIALAREHRGIRTLLGFQVVAVLTFTIAIPVEVVFAQRSLHSGAGGYGALLTAWGGGAVVGSLVYARWRRVPDRLLIAGGAASLGVGMLVMAVAPSLAVAIPGAALAGVANGLESVAVRTALQEQVEQRWMALIMSLSESIFQAVPGAGILIGGAIAATAGPRAALAVAGGGALVVAALAWTMLRFVAGRPVVAAVPDDRVAALPEDREVAPPGAQPSAAARR